MEDSRTDDATHGDESDSVADVLAECLTYTVVLFAVIAVALAVFVLLLDVADQDTLGVAFDQEAIMTGELTDEDITVGDEVAASLLVVLGVVGIVAAGVVGARFGRWAHGDDGTLALAAAVSTFAGVFVLWFLSGAAVSIFTNIAAEYGHLLINGFLAGIGGAIAAAGGVLATRTFAPGASEASPAGGAGAAAPDRD